MRLPHYLTRAPSGVFHFRMRLPAVQRAALGRREVRLSLGTRDRRTAQIAALTLAQRYAQALGTLAQGQDMATRDEIIAQALAAAESGRLSEKYKISLPGVEIEANNAREHRQVIDMLQSLPRALAPAAAVPARPAQTLTLRDAVRRWESTLPAVLHIKTRNTMRSVVRSLVETLGASRDLPSITRADVALWLEGLQRSTGASTPTLANKQSYANRFFSWAQGAGLYAAGDSPAQGHIKYGAREKRHRRALGWRALTLDEVRALYAPDSLARVPSLAVRWGVLLGLYTGARVSEIAQLGVVDFIEQDGLPCVRITDEGKGQSLKTDASRRVVPLHPDLVALGILDRLDALRQAAGPDRLAFLTGDPVRTKARVNGAGDWLSKSFTRWLGKSAILTDAEKGRVGFHSLRKTVVQTLQAAGVAAEVRAAIVGHELDDEHHAAYSTRSPTKAAAEALGHGLCYGLALGDLRPLLTENSH